MTDSNALEKVTPADLAGRLRERIRDTLGELIPEAQWDEMMKAEAERFLKPSTRGSGYHAQSTPSDFTRIVQEEFGTWARARIKEHLEGEEWTTAWEADGKMKLPVALRELLAEKMPDMLRELVMGMLAGTFEGAKQSALMELEQRLQRG